MKMLRYGLLLMISVIGYAQTPYPMSGGNYSENFSDISNWTNNFASGTGANRWGAVAVNATGTIPDGKRITAASATFVTGSSGGVQKGSAQTAATTSIVLLSTGATDNSSSAAIDLYLDFAGRNAGTLSFDWSSVNNSTGDRKGSLRIYTTTDGTTFTELTGAQVLNFTNNVVSSGSITTVALPSSFNGSSSARVRFYYHNGSGGTTGSRPKISIDNIAVTSTSSASVSVDSSSFNGAFGSVESGSGSSEHSFSVSGTSLTSDITVTAPTGFQVSLTSGSGFASSVSISPSSGTVSATTVYAKFTPNAVQAFSGNITVAATGATTFNVSVNGTGLTPTNPSIAVVGSLTAFGNVETGTTSSEQSYTVSGLNLSEDITVTAPSGFQVSTTSGSSYASSVALTQTEGSVGSTTLYVVYAPASASGASGSLNITHASGGATTQNIAVSGNAVASEPTVAGSISFGTNASTSLVVNMSGGNGGNRILVARSASAVSFTPTDGVAASGVNADFSAATDQGSSNKIVYDGTGSSVTVSGLTANTTYHFALFEYNVGTGTSQNYFTTAGTASKVTTTAAPTAIAANSIVQTGFTVRWNSVTGATYYEFDYSTDNTFTTGVVTDSSLTTSKALTSLSASTTYYYRVRAVNGGGASANSNTITASTAASEPVTQATAVQFANVGANQMDISWTNGSGASRLVVLRSGAAVNGLALDGKTYTGNAVFKSGDTVGAVASKNYAVYSGSGNSVTVTGLTAGTTYYVSVYEYNGAGSAENYLLTSAATGNQKTTGSSVASHVVIAEVYGGGGNSGAPYTHDYVILYNPTGSAVNVSAWSIQYASSAGSFSTVTNLTGSIAAGGYYGISLASGATGSALPFTAVVSNTGVNMSGTAGKVALASNQTAVTGVADPDIVDFIGYGTAANEREGTANAPAPSNSSSVRRRNNDGIFNAGSNGSGYDTDDNDRDFYVETSLGTVPALPVELTSFTASVIGRGVELVWKTATETNNHGFEVEKKVVGSWNTIGFVEGNGTTNAPQSYSFFDASARGTVQYRLKQIDRDGSFEYSGVVEATVARIVTEYALAQNYPNPFNPSTRISYDLPVSGHVRLNVYDMLGKEVATLVNGVRPAGENIVEFNAASLPSGMYFYTLRSANYTAAKKMLLVK